MPAKLLLIPILLIVANFARSQSTDPYNAGLSNFPKGFFTALDKQTGSQEKQLTRYIDKYLERLAKKESKLKRNLQKLDSSAASTLFSEEPAYLKQANDTPDNSSPVYIPYVDSLKTSLSFLQQHAGLLSSSKDVQQKINNSLSKFEGLQLKLAQAEQVKQLIRQRKQQIAEMLKRYTKLPQGLTKSFRDFNKEVYYYAAQLREYKEMLNEPEKLARKGLELLNKLPAFREFMQKNSLLASMFRLPGNSNPADLQAILAGLQTRTQVQQMIGQQIAAGGPNAMAQLQMNMQEARSALDKLKSKINSFGSGGTEDDMPDFRPNREKTRSFLRRLEVGTDIQTSKGNNYFPVTTDLGFSVGYKLNERSIIGIGASYKMGWGQGWRNIEITGQGAGLRSFVNWQIKGSISLSGGYEMNYRSEFNRVEALKNLTAWQQSGLIGLSKVMSLRSKFFKKTKMSLLFDFLSYEQVPRTQPVLFRVGYNF